MVNRVNRVVFLVIIGLVAARPAAASSFFLTDFDTGTLHAELQTIGSASWSVNAPGTAPLTGEMVAKASGSGDTNRSYIRTIDTDYNLVDFTLDVRYSQGGGAPDGLVFVGLGDPGPGGSEPRNAYFARLHPSGTANFDGIALSNNGSTNYLATSFAPVGAGLHAIRLTKTGSTLQFYVDFGGDGSYVTWGPSADMSLPLFSHLNSTNSRLFFGTGNSTPQFDSFEVSGTEAAPVPEPATLSLVGIGAAAAIRRRLRRTAN